MFGMSVMLEMESEKAAKGSGSKMTLVNLLGYLANTPESYLTLMTRKLEETQKCEPLNPGCFMISSRAIDRYVVSFQANS